MAAAFGWGSSPRAVLAAIVADPALGPQTLSRPATLFSLLSEYLPDSPGETGPLLAAAQVDVPGALRGHIADGVPGRMAIELAAAKLAARTSFADQACLWAASEFAVALGLAAADQVPPSLSGGDAATTGPLEPTQAAWAGVEPLVPAARVHPRRPRSGRRLQIWLAVITGAVLAAGAIGIALHSGPHLAGRQSPDPGYRHAKPGPGAASGRPGTANARPGAASPGPGTASVGPGAASPGPGTASPGSGTASPAPASPALVAREYVAEVNERDWRAVWQLGGGNIVLRYEPDPGPVTYPEMVARFQHTVMAAITSLTSAGDTVSMHVSALDSADVTQYYEISLVIGHGRILSGSQYFLGP